MSMDKIWVVLSHDDVMFLRGYVVKNGIKNTSGKLLSTAQIIENIVASFIEQEKGIGKEEEVY